MCNSMFPIIGEICGQNCKQCCYPGDVPHPRNGTVAENVKQATKPCHQEGFNRRYGICVDALASISETLARLNLPLNPNSANSIRKKAAAKQRKPNQYFCLIIPIVWMPISKSPFLIDTIAKRYDGIMGYGLGNIESIALDLLPHRKTLTIRGPLA